MKGVSRSRLPLVLHLFGENQNISMERVHVDDQVMRKVMTIMMTHAEEDHDDHATKKITTITPVKITTTMQAMTIQAEPNGSKQI